MIAFRTDYRPGGFDRPVTEEFKNRIRGKLEGVGITFLLVIIKHDSARRRLLDFEGAEEDVVKARMALAEYFVGD